MMSGSAFAFSGLVMMLFWILFWVSVVAGIVWLVLTLSRSQERIGGDGSTSSARRTLEERLARGEIDPEEFRTRRAAIEETTR